MPISTFLLPMQLSKQPSPISPFSGPKIEVSLLDHKDRDPALPPNAGDVIKAYDDWISPAPTSYNSIPPSPLAEIERKGEGINWEDVRIQSWNSQERAENGEYLTWALQAKNSLGMFEVSQTLPPFVRHAVPPTKYQVDCRIKLTEFSLTGHGSNSSIATSRLRRDHHRLYRWPPPHLKETNSRSPSGYEEKHGKITRRDAVSETRLVKEVGEREESRGCRREFGQSC